jgi:hypothetical protein
MRTPIEVGQVRADPDPRHKGRTVTVLSFDSVSATVKSNRGRTSYIYCHRLELWPLITTDPKDTQ